MHHGGRLGLPDAWQGTEQPKKGQGMTLDEGRSLAGFKVCQWQAESQGQAKSPASYMCTSRDEELECKAQREIRERGQRGPAG